MVDYEDLANEAAPSDDQLKVIAGLIERQTKIEDWIAEEEERLREAKSNLAKVQNELLPEAMMAAGVTEFTDINGYKVTVKEDLRAGITAANKDWCFTWLRDNGHGDIIRNEFKITYGVGEDTSAQELVDTLKEQEQDFSQKEYIHHRTLPAFVRAELEENPHDSEWEERFGVFRQKVAKIERP